MDLDNIKDIEVLRNMVKKNMVKVKKDFYSEDGTGYLFKKDHQFSVNFFDVHICSKNRKGATKLKFSCSTVYCFCVACNHLQMRLISISDFK